MIKQLATKTLEDVQVYENSDIQSLPVNLSENEGAKIGSVVKIGDTFGVLMTDVCPTVAEQKKEWESPYFVPQLHSKFYGGNPAGHASVYVGGQSRTFRIEVDTENDAAAAGAAVYAKVEGNKVVVTLKKAGATQIGFLSKPIAQGATKATAIVTFKL